MNFMQGATVQAPPPPVTNPIPRQPSESKPIQIATIPAAKKKVTVAPPVANPNIQMKPPVDISDLLKDINKSIVPPPGNGPPPPEKIKKGSNKPGSTGKNSVVIKL
jgi:hypothetical protein